MDVDDTAAVTHSKFFVLYTCNYHYGDKCNYHYGDKQIQLAILICTKSQLVN